MNYATIERIIEGGKFDTLHGSEVWTPDWMSRGGYSCVIKYLSWATLVSLILIIFEEIFLNLFIGLVGSLMTLIFLTDDTWTFNVPKNNDFYAGEEVELVRKNHNIVKVKITNPLYTKRIRK